jgi:hypothetical protein
MRERERLARIGQHFVTLGFLLDPSRGNERVPCRLTLEEACKHMVILGATGCGKSSLLEILMDGLLQQGVSVVLLDPHAVLDEVLLHLAAQHGVPVVHLNFDLAAGRSSWVTPWSFFHLRESTGRSAEELAHVAVACVTANFSATNRAGFVENALFAAFALTASFPDELTLGDIETLLMEPSIARRFLVRLREPMPTVERFFGHLARMSPMARFSNVRFALARIDAILSVRGARLTLCGREPVDLQGVFRSQCVVIASAKKAIFGDGAALLLGLVLESVRLTLMQRPVPCAAPHVAVVVDELASLSTSAAGFSAILAEARKIKASLVAALQSLNQPEGSRRLLEDFLTNTGTKILFGLGPSDAARFKHLPRPAQPSAHCISGYRIDGHRARLEPDRPEGAVLDDRRWEERLQGCAPRTFHLSLMLDGVLRTVHVLALPRPEPPLRSPRLLGARPVHEVEAELRERLQRQRRLTSGIACRASSTFSG